MRTSENIKDIAAALSAFQSECPNVVKSATNPFFKSKYATLDAILDTIRPWMSKHELMIVQGGGYVESTVVTVTTRLVHTSGQWFESDYHLPGGDGNKYTPQSVGSAITYGRRYGLSAMLGIASEEDTDGNGQSHGQTHKVESRPPNVPPHADAGNDALAGKLKEARGIANRMSDDGLIDDDTWKSMLAFITDKSVDTVEKMEAIISRLNKKRAQVEADRPEQKEIF